MTSETPPQTGQLRRLRRRRLRVWILSGFTIVLLALLVIQSTLNILPFFTPDSNSGIVTLYVLSAFNFVAFVVFLLILGRNVLKLRRERLQRRLGSRLKTRMVIFSIGISLLPISFLFLFSYGLLNRSIDKWFSFPAAQFVHDAKYIQDRFLDLQLDQLQQVVSELGKDYETGALHKSPAGELATSDPVRHPGVIYVEVISNNGREVYRNDLLKMRNRLAAALEQGRQKVLNGSKYKRIERGGNTKTIFLVAGIPTSRGGLLAAQLVPQDLADKFSLLAEKESDYRRLSSEVKKIKAANLGILALITLFLLFAATWAALYVARGIAEPIQALARGTDQLAQGNLDYRVSIPADDELAVLVRSFNQMAQQLAENRQKILASTEELQETNQALEERRRYIETVLQSISTGVFSLDNYERLTTINDGAVKILQLSAPPALWTPLSNIVSAGNLQTVRSFTRRVRRGGTLGGEVELEKRDGSRFPAALAVADLVDGSGQSQGTVVMIEDLTMLIKAQRAAAWSQVARRLAHEIKNPLTPIKLSAERIAKRFTAKTGTLDAAAMAPVVRSCTRTILDEVSSLQRLVDEFSRFARMPEARLEPTQLNDVVSGALKLYEDRLNGMKLESNLDSSVPVMQLDQDQMKRTLVNLIDNSMEAIGPDNGGGTIEVATRFDAAAQRVILTVTDDGHGLEPGAKDKLFEPYFSTRRRGTGLGLAIVHHIVTLHEGKIFAEDHASRGTRVVIELPVRSEKC